VEFVDLHLRASSRLAMLFAVAHVAAIVAVLSLPWVWWLQAGACVLLLASAANMIAHRALLVAPGSVVRLRIARDGSCQLQTRDHRLLDGRLCPGWFVSPLMIVLRVARPGARRAHGITLLPDAADAQGLRELRIFLRFALDPSARRQ
jgi:hypothetical protein